MAKKAKIEAVETAKTEIYEKIFTLVNQNGNVRIAVADKIVSNLTFANEDEAIAFIDSKPWELIINATCLIYELSKQVKK